MHIKTRGQRAMLYRSTWVKKGAEGNTHGFARQTYLGSLTLNSESIPPDLLAMLTPDEVGVAEKKVLEPARKAASALRTQAENRLKDPMWRLDEAARLIREAATLSATAVVPQGRVKALTDAASMVNTFGVSSTPARVEQPKVDPLNSALKSIRDAAKAVMDGYYGHAPVDGARSSMPYAIWMDISREIDGTSGSNGLLRALQSRGWVKVRGAAAR